MKGVLEPFKLGRRRGKERVRTGCPSLVLPFFSPAAADSPHGVIIVVVRVHPRAISSSHTGEKAVSETWSVPARLSSICKVGDTSVGYP